MYYASVQQAPALPKKFLKRTKGCCEWAETMMLLRRSAIILAAQPSSLCPYVSNTTIINSAFDSRSQSVRTFAGHSQFANIKVHSHGAL
jgi:hypothetical protein